MKSKIVLVTGGAVHLGKRLVERLAAANYSIIIHYHKNEAAAKRLAKTIGAKKVIQADLTNPLEVRKMFKSIGSIDILINTVGGFIYKPLAQTSSQEFHDCLHNNLLTAWHTMVSALPSMRRKHFGRIINFGSVGCDQVTTRPLTTPYYIAKTGLLMLTKSLAREVAADGITVNMISPGILPTGVKPNADVPIISFDDITEAVLFLIRPENSHINGANLEISGGWRPE